MEQPKPINEWIKINHILWSQKIIIAILSAITGISVIALLCFSFQKPLVIGLTGHKNIVFNSERKLIEIKDADMKDFIQQYLDLRYSFGEFNKEKMLQDLSPFCTKGFIERLSEILSKTMGDKTSPISQRIIINEIKITEKEIIATIDRLAALDKLKIVMPLQLSFNVIEGVRSKWNPLGLYINGVVEYENN